MKRLTKRLEDGQAVMDCDTCARSGSTCTVLACRNKLKDRICDYEDVMQSNGLVEQKHGRWIEKQEPITWCEDDVEVFWECSICGCLSFGESNYCPNCGADMR